MRNLRGSVTLPGRGTQFEKEVMLKAESIWDTEKVLFYREGNNAYLCVNKDNEKGQQVVKIPGDSLLEHGTFYSLRHRCQRRRVSN